MNYQTLQKYLFLSWLEPNNLKYTKHIEISPSLTVSSLCGLIGLMLLDPKAKDWTQLKSNALCFRGVQCMCHDPVSMQIPTFHFPGKSSASLSPSA